MKNLNKIPILWTIVLLTFLTLTQVANAATNTFTFNNTIVGAYSGPNFPAGGALTNISGAVLAAGDVVLFDGIVVDPAGTTSDSWGAVNLNAGGYLGLTSADLGVLVETGSANTSPGQLYLDGGFSADFAIDQGYTSNRLQIVLTCTETGSATNMDYQVNIDHGLTGSFNDTLSGSGVTFAGNTIALTFGSQSASHLFIQNQPVIALAAPTMTPASGILTPGHTATFTANFTAGYPLNISLQWLSNSVPIAGANGLSYTNLPVTASNNGDKYSLVVSNLNNPANVVTSAVDTVTVRSTPGYFTFDFADTYYAGSGAYGAVVDPGVNILGTQLLAGDTVLFDALVLGFPGGGSGAWVAIDFNGSGYGNLFGTMGVLTALGPSQQNGQLFINGGSAPNISPSGVQTNRVRVELFPSSAGSTTNMGWLVEVDQNVSGTFLPAVTGTNLTFPGNSIPLTFGFQLANGLVTENPQAVSIYSDASPASQSVPLGGPATVSILAKGWSPAYQWYKNGSQVPGANSRSYTIASTTPADNGDQLFCVLSNTLNSANVVTSSVATVYIELPASVSWYPSVDGTTWDLATANWTTNGGTSQTLFANGDNVTFDSQGYNLGGSTITVTNAVGASTTTFNVSGSEVYSLTGAGTLNGLNLLLTGDGSGGLDLLTSASFANVTIAAGTLQVGNGSVNGSLLANNITNNGTILFNNTSGELIIGGTFAGSGSIFQEGAGTTSLTATNNVYTIGSIDAGTLKIANAPLGDFTDNGTLEFSSAMNFPFTNVVSGTGGYVLSGYQTNIFTGVSSFTGRNTFLYTVAIVDNPSALGDPVNGSSDITGGLRLGGLYLSNNITWSQPLSFESRDAAAAAFAPHLDNLSGTNTVTSPLTFNNGGTEFNVESDSGLLAIQSVLVNNATSDTNVLDLQGSGNGEWDGVITDGPGGAGVDSLNVRVRGSGFWALNGINTYSGITTVSSGTLCGTGAISGPVTVATGATIAPGYGGIGTFTVNSNLTLAAGSFTSVEINKTAATQDQIVGLTSLNYGGTLIVSNLSGTLTTNDFFQLFSSASYTGTFAAISPAIPGAGLVWNTNTLAIDGTLRISSGMKPTPHFTSIHVSGTTLTISGTNGSPGGQYVLLGSTNMALPLIQWTPVLTNSFDGSGNINLSTNIINPTLPQEFYILSQ